eukprot:symbB.v1.2.018106.t1/scaffold1432.1/size120878/10
MMMSGSSDVPPMPTGLKGKLASLEDFISMQNEELAAQRQEIESLRSDKAGIEEHYQGQLQELKKTMVGDVQRLQDEALHTTKGGEFSLATADHDIERGEDILAAADFGSSEKTSRN